jgi:hypothetical protein
MSRKRRLSSAPVLGAVAIALLAAFAAPATAQATAETAPVSVDRERMTQYVRAHRVLNDARDEFHGKVGRLHDEQGRERARIEMEEQIAAGLEAHDLTRAEYDELTVLISLDGDTRTLFDEVMLELAEEGAGS